jgi:hypothetical protein
MARKAAAKVAKGGAATAVRNGGKAATLIIIVGTVLAITALPLCILFVVGLMPTLVAAIVDRDRERFLARAVAAMNLAGIVQPTLAVLHIGLNLASVEHVLADAQTWLVMYGAAAIGWLLTLGMPSIARIFVDIRADQMQRQLRDRADALVKEWGEEVQGGRTES